MNVEPIRRPLLVPKLVRLRPDQVVSLEAEIDRRRSAGEKNLGLAQLVREILDADRVAEEKSA